ncbi:hypothetical protein COO60DRAFT_1042880 [Scenedesmus sp. NREL 46B-D3]|nr:hypothetical protein COO60DRAFT_1042880 [Scenedesmus sp. NREL 46B-D3]
MAGCVFGSKEFNNHHFDATFPPKHAAHHYAIAGTNVKSDIHLRRRNAQPIDPLHWNTFWWKYSTSCNPFLGVKELMDRIMRTNYSKDQAHEDGLKRKETDAQATQHRAETKKLNQEQEKQQQQQWIMPTMPPTPQSIGLRSSAAAATPGHMRAVNIRCYAVELVTPQQEASLHGARSATHRGTGRNLQEAPAAPEAAAHAGPAVVHGAAVSWQSDAKDPCSDEPAIAERYGVARLLFQGTQLLQQVAA